MSVGVLNTDGCSYCFGMMESRPASIASTACIARKVCSVRNRGQAARCCHPCVDPRRSKRDALRSLEFVNEQSARGDVYACSTMNPRECLGTVPKYRPRSTCGLRTVHTRRRSGQARYDHLRQWERPPRMASLHGRRITRSSRTTSCSKARDKTDLLKASTAHAQRAAE
jgi:hypothetical protein